MKEKGFTGAALAAIVSTEKNKLATLFRKGLLKQYESSKDGFQWQIYRELEGGVSVPANNDKGWPLTLTQFFKDALESYGADIPNRQGADIQSREIIAGDQKKALYLYLQFQETMDDQIDQKHLIPWRGHMDRQKVHQCHPGPQSHLNNRVLQEFLFVRSPKYHSFHFSGVHQSLLHNRLPVPFLPLPGNHEGDT